MNKSEILKSIKDKLKNGKYETEMVSFSSDIFLAMSQIEITIEVNIDEYRFCQKWMENVMNTPLFRENYKLNIGPFFGLWPRRISSFGDIEFTDIGTVTFTFDKFDRFAYEKNRMKQLEIQEFITEKDLMI
jgi:hypothetical protein